MRRFDEFRSPGLVYPARLEPSSIGFLVMIIEAHEGLAVVRTKDASLGIVEFWISPSMQATFEDLLVSLRAELGLTTAPPRLADMSSIMAEVRGR